MVDAGQTTLNERMDRCQNPGVLPYQDTVAKRADVWSDRQLQAGWEYLLRRSIR